MTRPKKFIFLDRDGVINRAVRDGYVLTPDEIEILPDAAQGIALLNQVGYTVLVVSNQQGVGKGLLSLATLDAISQRIRDRIAPAGGAIERFYYCPHLASEDCPCRKPRAGLFHQAAEDFGIDLEKCYFVGDTASDMEAAANAGVVPIFVSTGLDDTSSILEENFPHPPELIATSLLEAAEWLAR